MRIPVVITACCFGLMASISAAAAQPQTAQDKQQSEDQKIVCKVSYHEGMVIRSKDNCATEAKWRAERSRTQRALQDLELRALTAAPRG